MKYYSSLATISLYIILLTLVFRSVYTLHLFLWNWRLIFWDPKLVSSSSIIIHSFNHLFSTGLSLLIGTSLLATRRWNDKTRWCLLLYGRTVIHVGRTQILAGSDYFHLQLKETIDDIYLSPQNVKTDHLSSVQV